MAALEDSVPGLVNLILNRMTDSAFEAGYFDTRVTVMQATTGVLEDA